LQELREEFDKHGLWLTAPLGVMPDTIRQSYDIPAISKYLDFMFPQSYAYYGHWNEETGPNAPLYPISPDGEYNVVSSLKMIPC
jgi:chitinase